MAFTETLGVYFEIAADPSKAIRAVSDFQNSIEKLLGMARGSVGRIAGDIEQKWGLASGSLLRTGAAAQAAVKDLAYLTAGAGALAAGALVLANRWATAGTEIFEASEKTGMSASNLSGLRATAKLLDENFGSLTVTLARMGRNIEAGLQNPSSEAGKTLKALYKNSDELQKLGLKPLDDRILDVDKRIFNLNSTTKQNLMMQALAGRGYMEVRSILAQLATEGYGPAIEMAKKLGMNFDDEGSRKARQFKIEMADMQAKMDSLGLAIGKEVVPAFSQLFALFDAKFDKLRNKGFFSAAIQELRDYAATVVYLTAKQALQVSGIKDYEGELNILTMKIAGGADLTQHMTDRLTSLNSMAAAVAKGTGNLGDAFKKTGKDADEAARKMAEAIRSYTDLSRSLQVQLDAGANAALKRYLETNNKILELSGKLDVTYLRQLNRTLFQKESTEELAKAESALNTELTKHVPVYQFNIQAVTALAAAERLRLPLIIDETNRLGQLLQASESVVSELMTAELPARQRINLQIQRQADLARREIEIKRQEYREGKILLAQKEAAEVQYTEVMKSLSDQRRELIANEAGSMRSSLMMLNQAMGMGIANALIYGDSIGQAMAMALKSTLASIAAEALIRALYNTALGFYYLALTWGIPNPASTAAFTAAAFFGAITGAAAIAGRAIPGGGQKVAGPTPYGVAGGTAGSTTGVATGAAAERGPTTIFRVEGIDLNKMYSGQQLKDLIGAISGMVKDNGVVLHASTSERTLRRT